MQLLACIDKDMLQVIRPHHHHPLPPPSSLPPTRLSPPHPTTTTTTTPTRRGRERLYQFCSAKRPRHVCSLHLVESLEHHHNVCLVFWMESQPWFRECKHLSEEITIRLQKIHQQIGHRDNRTLVRLLKQRGTHPWFLKTTTEHRCSACGESRPRVLRHITSSYVLVQFWRLTACTGNTQ